MPFSDEPYVYALRRRVWTPGPHGRAAVMVGAGYSLNAIPRSPSAASFPLWTAIAEALYDDLYPGPPSPDRDAEIELAAAGGGMMRLAQEYHATFGRGALDDLVQRAVPDADHDPGDLHVDLLDLPWADVFTTNYDTLLERSRPRLASRRYDLVLTRHDLPYASAPRIVKLHGSFPSHRPFVFTEEDYRQYPRDAAPFVGTVRQSLMEHDVVLLGFSGEDPNFLAWLGWVRDELQEASPAVYLCGVLDLSPGNRKILQGRGVTPIDLGQLVPDGHPDRHGVALRWLLDSLANGRPPNGLRWPKSPPSSPSAGSPFQPLPPPPGPGAEPLPNRQTSLPRPVNQPVPPDDLQVLTREWAQTRAQYPGWIWTPRENRNRLRRKTDPWSAIVLERASELESAPRLRLLAEYVWRLGHIYEPLRLPLVEAVVSALDEDDGSGRPDDRERLALYLLDGYRSEPPSDFEPVDARAQTFTSLGARAARAYVHATRSLALLDAPGAERALDTWSQGAGPLWDVRRAGVLLELGRRDEAVALAADVRERAREPRREPSAHPFRSPSIEGVAQYLIDRALDAEERWRDTVYRERDDELASIRCDPSAEMQTFEKRLEVDPPGLAPTQTSTLDAFGRERVSYSIGGPRLDYDRYREAFEYLGVHHDAGLPLWFGLRFNATRRAALWLADLSTETATDTLVRSLDHEALGDHLDRLRVAALPEGEVSSRLDAALDALARSLPNLRSLPRRAVFAPHARDVHVAYTAATLLSRLAFRLSPARRLDVAQIALAPFSGPLAAVADHEMRPFEALLSEALSVLTPEQSLELLPQVAHLPLLGEYNVSDPFRSLSLRGVTALPEDAADAVTHWLREAEYGDPSSRTGALSRLQRLYAHGLLNEEDAREFGRVLWSQRGPDGLPDRTVLRRWVLLSLPEPQPGLAQTAVRHALLDALAKKVESSSVGMGGLGGMLLDDLARTAPPTHPAERPSAEMRWIDWQGDRQSVMDALGALWASRRDRLSSEDDIGQDDIRNTLAGIPDVLRRVVLPRTHAPEGENELVSIQSILDIQRDLQAAGVPTRSLLPEILAIDRDRLLLSLDTVELEIRRGLASTDADTVGDAAEAMGLWATATSEGRVPPPPDSLFDELGDVVLTRRPRVLLRVLHEVNDLLRWAPDTIPDSLASRLCDALRLLLSETDLPSVEDRLAARTDTDRLQILRRPDVRSAAAEMALRLRRIERVRGECDDTLEDWVQVVNTDPFPVVRWVADRLTDEG